MLRLRADARRSTQFDDHRLFSACDSDRTRCTKNSAASRAEMYGGGLSPYLRDSTYFFQGDGRKNLGRDPALRETRVRDGAKTRKAAASRLRRNSKAPFELISRTEFVERAELKSSASSETQLLLPAMFRVSVS